MNFNQATEKWRNNLDYALHAVRVNAASPDDFAIGENHFKFGSKLKPLVDKNNILRSLETMEFARKLERTLPVNKTPKKAAKLKI
ncbi:hypothetical protein AWB71_05301 [Caballeronia peredens]|nr:hypothetical protein AWB71_05301 [Caballeronia peredens]